MYLLEKPKSPIFAKMSRDEPNPRKIHPIITRGESRRTEPRRTVLSTQYETESNVPSRRINTDQVRDPPSPPNRNLHYEMSGHGSPNPAIPPRNLQWARSGGRTNPSSADILTSDEPDDSDQSEKDIFSTPNNSSHSSGGEKDSENDQPTSPFDEARGEDCLPANRLNFLPT